MFDPELLELMPMVAELRPKASRDNFGQPTFGSPVYPHCHVQMTGRQVYMGDTVRYEEGLCILDGVYAVDTSWQLFIPQPQGANREVKVMSVDQDTDEDGWHHTTVHFGAL